jgi:hypothetical protein
LTLSKTGSITGKVATAGVYTIDLTASNGTASGDTGTGTLTLTVEKPPVIATTAATAVGTNAATLNATVNPEGSDTMVSFQYGTTTTSLGTTVGPIDAGTGTTTGTVTFPLTGIMPGLKYYYRAVAAKVGGSVASTVTQTFTTAKLNSVMPYLSAASAELLINLTLPSGTTVVTVQYGTTLSYGTTVTAQSAGTSSYTAFLSGLTAGATYHYRIVVNGVPGPDETFVATGFTTSEVVTTGTVSGDFKTLGNPAISGGADIAYQATLLSGLYIIEADNSGGIPQMVAESGTAAGNAIGATSPFTSFSDPVYNANQAVAFAATLASKITGLWTTSGGTLSPAALSGQSAPSTSATFSTFNSLGLTDTAGVVFDATITGTGITSANNMGIWEGQPSSLNRLLLLGQQVNGQAITKFTFLPAGEAVVNGQTRGFTSSGDIIASVTYANKATGLVLVSGAGTASAPFTSGATDPITQATFASFGNPAINNHNDHLAFTGTLTTGGNVSSTTNTGLWADDSAGSLQLIARVGIAGGAPLFNGGVGTFKTLGDPAYNNNDAVAFRATLATTGTDEVPTTAATGIWCDSTGSLALVAQQGQQAPGCPTGVMFATFTELALPDTGGSTGQGGVVFTATLSGTGVTTSNSMGIFAVDNNGNLQLIVRTGDIFNGKTITGLSFLPVETGVVYAQTRSFDPYTADLCYLATFNDNSQAIFQVAFP